MTVKKTADLVDRHDAKLAFCDHPLVKFGAAEGFEGEIATVKCFEDNALLRETLEQPGNGRVLVVDGGGSTRCAIVGDIIAGLARDNGWAGLVLNGSIRDSVEIDEMDFAVFAIGTSPNGKNINDGVGALHPAKCAAAVRKHRADLGIALDGDNAMGHLVMKRAADIVHDFKQIAVDQTSEKRRSFDLAEVPNYLHPATVRELLVQAVLDSPMFMTRWRWVAGVALALPRFRGGKKVPPPLVRMDAEDLIAAIFPDQLACAENIVGAREVPDHPLIRQTIADCLEEAMDIAGLERLLGRIRSGAVRAVTRDLT